MEFNINWGDKLIVVSTSKERKEIVEFLCEQFPGTRPARNVSDYIGLAPMRVFPQKRILGWLQGVPSDYFAMFAWTSFLESGSVNVLQDNLAVLYKENYTVVTYEDLLLNANPLPDNFYDLL